MSPFSVSNCSTSTALMFIRHCKFDRFIEKDFYPMFLIFVIVYFMSLVVTFVLCFCF